MKIEFTKVDATNPAVQNLAKQSGEKVSVIVSILNQQLYRKAYNKAKQAEMKQLRLLIKAHPELLKEVK